MPASLESNEEGIENQERFVASLKETTAYISSLEIGDVLSQQCHGALGSSSCMCATTNVRETLKYVFA